MFDRLSIRQAMWSGATVIAVAALATVAITNLELGELRAKHYEQDAITSEIRAFDAVRQSVIQIQQFLTDVSATGRPDGFADAERNATAAISGLRTIADEDALVREAALALVADVSRFHDAGKAMANEYLAHGREAGNRAMSSAGGFDEQADQIDAKVAALSKKLDAHSAELSEGAMAAERNARWILTGSLLILIALVAASLLLVWRRTIPSIVSLRGAIDGLRQSADAETRLPPMSGEFQEIAASFTALLEKLRTEQAERDVVNRFNERIRAALDNTSSAAMVLDATGAIIYLNGAAERLYARRLGDLRAVIPDFAADRLVGAPISLFAALDRNSTIFSGPLRTHQVADLRFGAAALRVTASPVVSSSGENVGAIVEWLDRTDEVEAEVELGQTIDAAASGHLERRVAVEGKRGFFAVAARQMNALLDTHRRVFTDLQRVLGALAVGRLGERITADYEGMYARIKADANKTGEQLAATMAEIRSAATQVRNDARELSRGTENLSARTEEQASSLQETASSMEEMTSTIKQNADNAALANRLATQAAEVAERGTSVVTDAVAAMGEINASSRRIADIIGVVDEIALQTNLLALNAAVEAARAGEQGRGFAVVASEVRSLASRSAVAAKEIKALIQDSLDKVDGGSKLVDDSGKTLGEISAGMAKVRDLVAAISMASSEQARGVDEINRAVMQIDDTTQQNAALVEQTSAANQALTDQADRLSELVSSFDLGDAPTLQVVPAHGLRVVGAA